MSDDLLPNPIPDPPDPPRTASRITCDFCECSLTVRGDVLKMSAKAKAFRDAADAIERASGRVSELEGQLQTVRDELTAARAATPAKGKGFRLFEEEEEEE